MLKGTEQLYKYYLNKLIFQDGEIKKAIELVLKSPNRILRNEQTIALFERAPSMPGNPFNPLSSSTSIDNIIQSI